MSKGLHVRWDSSVTIVTRLGSVRPRNRGLILDMGKFTVLSTILRDRRRTLPTFSTGVRGFSLSLGWPGLEAVQAFSVVLKLRRIIARALRTKFSFISRRATFIQREGEWGQSQKSSYNKLKFIKLHVSAHL